MERVTFSFIILQTSFAQILSSHPQPSFAQYLQLAGLGPLSSPVPSISSSAPLTYSSSSAYLSYPLPKTNSPLPPIPLTALAELSAAIPVPPSKAIPKSEPLRPSTLDPNVLNNLAIALQLLIVSNILNMPSSDGVEPLPKLTFPRIESIPKYESVPIHPFHSKQLESELNLEYSRPLYSVESQVLPNSNFLGSAGFAEPSMFGPTVSVRPNPRSSLTLMSPYEALGPNSPYSDPILSSVYSPTYSKKDLKSPYASMIAADGHRDLFSVADLF